MTTASWTTSATSATSASREPSRLLPSHCSTFRTSVLSVQSQELHVVPCHALRSNDSFGAGSLSMRHTSDAWKLPLGNFRLEAVAWKRSPIT